MSCGIPFTEGTHVRILIEISMKYRALYYAIEDTAIRIQSLKSVYIRRYHNQPSHRAVRVCRIDCVGGCIFYDMVKVSYATVSRNLQCNIALVTCVFLDYTGAYISIFRIVYKDFMRHFVLNLKSQDSNSLARPKLQPTRVPVS